MAPKMKTPKVLSTAEAAAALTGKKAKKVAEISQSTVAKLSNILEGTGPSYAGLTALEMEAKYETAVEALAKAKKYDEQNDKHLDTLVEDLYKNGPFGVSTSKPASQVVAAPIPPDTIENVNDKLLDLFKQIRATRAKLLDLWLAHAAEEDDKLLPWPVLPKAASLQNGCGCTSNFGASSGGTKVSMTYVTHPKNGNGILCPKCNTTYQNPHAVPSTAKKDAFDRFSAVQALVNELGLELDLAICTVDLSSAPRVLEFMKKLPVLQANPEAQAELNTWLEKSKSELAAGLSNAVDVLAKKQNIVFKPDVSSSNHQFHEFKTVAWSPHNPKVTKTAMGCCIQGMTEQGKAYKMWYQPDATSQSQKMLEKLLSPETKLSMVVAPPVEAPTNPTVVPTNPTVPFFPADYVSPPSKKHLFDATAMVELVQNLKNKLAEMPMPTMIMAKTPIVQAGSPGPTPKFSDLKYPVHVHDELILTGTSVAPPAPKWSVKWPDWADKDLPIPLGTAEEMHAKADDIEDIVQLADYNPLDFVPGK